MRESNHLHPQSLGALAFDRFWKMLQSFDGSSLCFYSSIWTLGDLQADCQVHGRTDAWTDRRTDGGHDIIRLMTGVLKG